MKIFLVSLLSVLGISVNAQDISYTRKIVDTLTSTYFWGRGYTKDGMKKAADFLSKEFKNAGLLPLDKKDFLQKFSFSANTFPGKMDVEVNSKKLVPGIDYIVGADSHSAKIKGKSVCFFHSVAKSYSNSKFPFISKQRSPITTTAVFPFTNFSNPPEA